MKILKYTSALLLMISSAFWLSCSDSDKLNEPLTVSKVSTVLDREVAISSAELAQYIIIQGTGLNAVNSIVVNDIEIDLKLAYITSAEITFPVPRAVPREISNLMTLKAGSQTVTTPLEVNIPHLQVDGMSNEFMIKGGTMKVVGNFFDLYEFTPGRGQLFFDGKDIEITEVGETFLSFVVPTDAVVGAKIKIVNPVDGEEFTVPGRYMERGNMLCDYDPFTGWGGGDYVTNGPNPAPVSGNYSHFKLSKDAAGDWEWSGTTTIAMIGVTYLPEVLANPEKYVLKFEVNAIRPLTKRQIRFYFSQINYDWEPFASGLSFSTGGEWKTLTLDLEEVWKGETPNDGVVQILGNSWAEDTDICFDNFRIVAKD